MDAILVSKVVVYDALCFDTDFISIRYKVNKGYPSHILNSRSRDTL